MFIVNEYVIYNTGCELNRFRTMGHYTFRRQLVFSKIDPEKLGEGGGIMLQV